VVATAKKKTVKKRSAKKARKPPRTRATKAAASKKRAKKSKRVVKKAKKAAKKGAKKPVAKKAAKKSAKKSAKKTKPAKGRSTPNKTSAAGKTSSAGKNAKAGIKGKAAARVAKPPASPERNSFYITTAIAYPNGLPHIGHAYEAIATDALARFERLDGKDVFFLTGTDEHGLKMVQTAEREKLPTMEVATRNAQRFKDMDERLNVSFDRFIRTTEEQHHRSSQEIWKRMAANGDIYLDSYSGW
jgi:methionyl-tRNA synthetase